MEVCLRAGWQVTGRGVSADLLVDFLRTRHTSLPVQNTSIVYKPFMPHGYRIRHDPDYHKTALAMYRHPHTHCNNRHMKRPKCFLFSHTFTRTDTRHQCSQMLQRLILSQFNTRMPLALHSINTFYSLNRTQYQVWYAAELHHLLVVGQISQGKALWGCGWVT